MDDRPTTRELHDQLQQTREEMRAELSTIHACLIKLEDRTFELSMRLSAASPAPTTDA